MRKGIDVSLYQGRIDWDKVKEAGYSFAIIKASQGENEGEAETGPFADPKFHEYISGAAEAGLNVGAYHFLCAADEKAAVEEAKFFLALLEPYRKSIGFWCACDVESRRLSKDKAQLTAAVNAFCEAVAAAGYKPMIYTNEDWLKYRLGDVSGWPLWLAKYRDKSLVPSLTDFPNMKLWQWGAEKINGVESAECDSNLEIIPWETDFSSFPGGDNQPAPWSEEAVRWAVDAKIIQGDEGGLRLRDFVTREQMCVFLRRLYLYMKGEI